MVASFRKSDGKDNGVDKKTKKDVTERPNMIIAFLWNPFKYQTDQHCQNRNETY